MRDLVLQILGLGRRDAQALQEVLLGALGVLGRVAQLALVLGLEILGLVLVLAQQLVDLALLGVLGLF